MGTEEERIRFKKILSNLPEKIRNQDIIVIVDDQPYTWNAAYLEVSNNSDVGKKILRKLKALEII